jgi:RAT1-interacting protein
MTRASLPYPTIVSSISRKMSPLKRNLSDLDTGDASQFGRPTGGPSQRPRLGSDATTSDPASFTISYPDVKQTNAPVRQIPFQKPTQLMSYSHDANHTQRFDNSAMRYYIDPPMGARLDCGYDRWIRKPDERGRLDGLLRAFLDMKAKGGMLPDSGVVSWRGIMTK